MASTIVIDNIFKALTVVKTETEYYDFDLEQSSFQGYFSLQVQIVSGAGILTFDYQESNDGSNFVDQGASSDLVTGLAGAGFTMYSFNPMVCKTIRIRATETGTAADVIINAWLAAQ
jgi:hypothetical protein